MICAIFFASQRCQHMNSSSGKLQSHIYYLIAIVGRDHRNTNEMEREWSSFNEHCDNFNYKNTLLFEGFVSEFAIFFLIILIMSFASASFFPGLFFLTFKLTHIQVRKSFVRYELCWQWFDPHIYLAGYIWLTFYFANICVCPNS